jgi:hypothetical protein
MPRRTYCLTVSRNVTLTDSSQLYLRGVPKVMSTFILQLKEVTHTKTNGVSKIWAYFVTFIQNVHTNLCISDSVAVS